MDYFTPFGQEHFEPLSIPSLGNRAPITIFTGLPAENPLRTLLPLIVPVPASIDFIRAQCIMRRNVLIQFLENIHRKTRLRRSNAREAAVKRHNDKTHERPVDFEVGDYVLRAQKEESKGHKLRIIWRGPQRITRAVSHLIFQCEDLISNSFSLLHGSRLKFYTDAQLDVSEELLDTVAHNNYHLNTVGKLLDIRWTDHKFQYKVCTKWVAFDQEDPTWELLVALQEENPFVLFVFFNSHPEQDLVASAKATMAQ